MAERDASRVQLDFPQLVADIISQLRLTGTVGLLEMSDQVTPVYIVAQRAGALSVTAARPIFTSAGFFDGSLSNPVNLAVIVDTGPQPAGDYDMFAQIQMTGRGTTIAGNAVVDHRNAANTGTLATLLHIAYTTVDLNSRVVIPLIRYTLGVNERLRISIGPPITGRIGGNIALSLAPTP